MGFPQVLNTMIKPWQRHTKNNLHIPLTPLCELALKHSSDKCPRIGHCYTPFYYTFLKNRRTSIKKVLEIGIGTENYKKYIPNYKVGASLFMWRDFFPNAKVFGADIERASLFSDERIATYYCDERKEADIKNLVLQIGSDIDLVIDDASHHIADQTFLFKTLMPLLNPSVTYVVEDCLRTRQLRKTFSEYNCFIPKLPANENHVRGALAIFSYATPN